MIKTTPQPEKPFICDICGKEIKGRIYSCVTDKGYCLSCYPADINAGIKISLPIILQNEANIGA